MKAGIKAVWLLLTAALTAAGLGAPVIGGKLLEANVVNDIVGNAIGMIGIPLGLLAGVIFITLFFIE